MQITDIDVETVMNVLKSPLVLSEFKLNSSLLDYIELRLKSVSSQSFTTINNIVEHDSGIVIKNNKIELADNWGVRLDSYSNPFIGSPCNIRGYDKYYLIADKSLTKSCSVLDKEFNFLGYVGSKGAGASQYTTPVDIAYSDILDKYFIVSQSQNRIQIYNGKTKAFEQSLTDVDMLEPVAIALSPSAIYVLCKSGTPAGSTGPGCLLVYNKDLTLRSKPLYYGKNGGNGSMFQAGELSSPKDLIVVSYGGIDHLYILNGNDEIGVIKTSDWSLTAIYNMSDSNLGLSRISLDVDNLYTTSKDTGKIFCIDRATGKVKGKFGSLADESSINSNQTLGNFNGLDGIYASKGTVVITESINNRIQVIGENLIAKENFSVTYSDVHLTRTNVLMEVSKSAGSGVDSTVKIVVGNDEYDVDVAIARRLSNFKIKLYIHPSNFTKNSKSIPIAPLYVMTQQVK